MRLDHKTTSEYFMLDYKQMARFTHYPSENTCLRHPYMVGDQGQKQWEEKLAAFFARHPGANQIVNARHEIIGEADTMPQRGGGFSVGDTVMIRTDRHSDEWCAQQIVGSEPNLEPLAHPSHPTDSYILEDGGRLIWSSHQDSWLAFASNSRSFESRARKPLQDEPRHRVEDLPNDHKAPGM